MLLFVVYSDFYFVNDQEDKSCGVTRVTLTVRVTISVSCNVRYNAILNSFLNELCSLFVSD